MKARGVLTVNCLPRLLSSRVRTRAVRRSIGEFDLVVSTKPFHPGGWQHFYGYRNTFVCVPHCYDPTVHYWPTAPASQVLDVVLAELATGISQAHARFREGNARHVMLSRGWRALAGGQSPDFPPHWSFARHINRQGLRDVPWIVWIAIAPVQRDAVVSGKSQPGD